ncbi:hypothetical protein H4217_001450 [Coemansia sp. RSA 1939]|nr:hypothetical protein H4217_001450 [Coemansia sp. RSA 1939]
MSSLLIFSLDDSGKTKHLETLESVFNFVFGLDGSLFYSVLNDKLRAFKIFGHQIGRPQSERACIFTEDNEELFVDITRTKDKRFHIINSSALDSSEVYIFDSKHKFWPAGADHKQSNAPIPLTLVRPRQKGVEYFVDHHNGEFAILTNSPRAESADKKQTASPLPFRLVRAPTLNPTSENWTELLSVADDETIEDVEIFKDHIMITIKRKGRPAVLIYDKNNQFFSELPLPYGGCCTVRPDSNPQLDTSSVRLRFSSPVHLDSVAKYDMRTMRQTQSWASTPLHIDPSRYSIQRVDVRNGNTNVPLTLVCQKSNMRAKGKPTLLRVYGAYGVSLEPEFRLEDIPLLLRGWTIALAHVRGGSELGREWYFGGKGKNKINSVHDLLACACFLLNREWTTCERLAISGVSAGGLVVGAALSMSPEYFRAATLHVPFVDPLSAMLDPKLPLTSVEVAEWGDPLTSQSDFEAIRQYAPYDNTHLLQKAKHVPSVLVTAGGQDKRVSVWQPAKWVARMRDSGRFVPNSHSGLQTDSHNGSRLLFYPKMNEGHFHANSNQSDSNDEDGFISAHAFRNAFLIDEVE